MNGTISISNAVHDMNRAAVVISKNTVALMISLHDLNILKRDPTLPLTD